MHTECVILKLFLAPDRHFDPRFVHFDFYHVTCYGDLIVNQGRFVSRNRLEEVEIKILNMRKNK